MTPLYQAALNCAASWSRLVNNRDKGKLLASYAGDLVYDGFALGTEWAGGPVVGILRDYGSDLVLDKQKLCGMAQTNPPSEKVCWYRYDPEGNTDGWEGSFVPCTVEEAQALFDGPLADSELSALGIVAKRAGFFAESK